MKKAEKKQIEAIVNGYLAQFGYSFEVGKGMKAEGNAWVNEKRIALKPYGDSKTLAHEIAHISQFETTGTTYCMSTPVNQRAGKMAIIIEHGRLTEEWMVRLSMAGIAQQYDKAMGISRKSYPAA